MATKENSKGKELEVGEIVSKSEQFIDKHKKNIIYGVVALAVVVGGFFWVRHGYLVPKEKKAEIALFKGEQYFARDSFAIALNGNGADYVGFTEIVDQYGSTKSGNLAKAYAGICHYRLGDPGEALKLLKSFNGKDQMVSPAITGLIGDCYVSLGDMKEGISYFEKAAKEANNEIVSPVYLKKAGTVYEELKQYDAAVKAYTTIKEQYFNSTEAADIDAYITRASELAKK